MGEKIDFYVSKKYALLLSIGGICLGIYVSAIQVIGFSEKQKETMNIVALVLSITSVVFIILASLLIIKENKNEQLKKEAEMNNRLLEAQKDYYTMIFQKDEETRKFRHDINNHFYCMRTLLYDKNYNELNKYLSKLNSDIVGLQNEIDTGNRMVNVITNNIKSRYSDVKFEWSGKLFENMSIFSMDLCTIFSNLLNNAFEAANKTEQKRVSVSIKRVESQLSITVSNNVKEKPNIINGELISAKNERNHGYGVKNVRRCVENNNGTLTLLFDNSVFSAEVIFYNILA
mgnify:FL=1